MSRSATQGSRLWTVSASAPAQVKLPVIWARTVFDELAQRAWLALAFVVPGAAVTVMLSYIRMLKKIVETPDIVPTARSMWMPRFLCESLSGAIALFCLRCMLRSRQHRVILSFYFGVGLAIVLAYVDVFGRAVVRTQRFTSADADGSLIAASLLLLCIAIFGVRIVASIPVALLAHWVFRITELREPSAYTDAIRRSFMVLSLLPVWIMSALIFFSIWPPALASKHLIILALTGIVLVEACLYGFHKIPFTCSYLPGKGNLQYVFWFCALFLVPLIKAAGEAEFRVLYKPWSYAAVVCALTASAFGVRWKSQRDLQAVKEMKFNEIEPPQLESLRLNRG